MRLNKNIDSGLILLTISILAAALLACSPTGGEQTQPASTPVAAQPTPSVRPTATRTPVPDTPAAAPATDTPAPLAKRRPAFQKTMATPDVGALSALLRATSPQSQTPVAPASGHSWTLPFYDDFSDPTSGWHVSRKKAGFQGYENGAFRMQVNNPNWLTFSGVPISVSDVIIEVDAKKGGGVDNNSFGVYCRQVGDNLYDFEVTSDGYYKIARFADNEYTELVPWMATRVIRPGHSTTRIRAECVGTSLALYANGTLLARANDSALSSGFIGLTAGSFDTPGVDILFDNFAATKPGTDSTENPPAARVPTIGTIVFAEDVTDDGELVNPTTNFPAGTTSVWAYFTFENMEDGQAWGQLWENDGAPYVDMRDETWEDGPSGWLAYNVYDDTPLSGSFTLTLYIGDRQVQQASFSVASPEEVNEEDSAAFGAIRFAAGVTAEGAPVGVASQFEKGVTEVYALFPYMNFTNGQAWSREWLLDGEVQVHKDLEWDEGHEGTTYYFFADDNGLEPGQYTLNLYIGGQVARSAGFEVTGPPATAAIPQRPATPEDLFDPEIMPAWRMLATSQNDLLRDLADLAVRHRIEIRLSDYYKGNAAYQAACNRENPQAGHIVVSRAFWKESSWEFVAATLGHELTHAVQHLNGGKCECTVEKEYYAWLTTLYVLQEMDRMDLLEARYRGVYDQNGRFDKDKLWTVVKKTYAECSEY